MIFTSLMTLKVKNKTWISNFQVHLQGETNLPFQFMFKISSSASTEKSWKLFLNVENCSELNKAWARFLFFFNVFAQSSCSLPLVSLALHLQRAHVSYAGDCLIAPANISAVLYAVAPSHARERCELRDPCLANDRNLNGSPLNFVEAHAVDPPAFFCERIVPLRCPETLFISHEHANFLFSVFRVVQGEAKTPKIMGCCRANFAFLHALKFGTFRGKWTLEWVFKTSHFFRLALYFFNQQ